MNVTLFRKGSDRLHDITFGVFDDSLCNAPINEVWFYNRVPYFDNLDDILEHIATAPVGKLIDGR